MIMGDMSEVLGVQSIVIPERPIKAGSTEMGKVENDDLITFLVKSMKTVQLVTSRPLVLQPAARTTSITRFRAPRAR